MSGGVAVLMAIVGLLLIIIAVKGTYSDVLAVLASGGVSNGSEPNNNPPEPTVSSGGGRGGVK